MCCVCVTKLIWETKPHQQRCGLPTCYVCIIIKWIWVSLWTRKYTGDNRRILWSTDRIFSTFLGPLDASVAHNEWYCQRVRSSRPLQQQTAELDALQRMIRLYQAPSCTQFHQDPCLVQLWIYPEHGQHAAQRPIAQSHSQRCRQ